MTEVKAYRGGTLAHRQKGYYDWSFRGVVPLSLGIPLIQMKIEHLGGGAWAGYGKAET